MKTNTKQAILAIILMAVLLTTYSCISAQTLLIKASVKLNSVQTLQPCEVKLLNMSTNECSQFTVVNGFTKELEYNRIYMVVISKKGYESKSIYINTQCDLKESFKYRIEVSLQPITDPKDDMVYQAGGIFYNKNKKQFDYFLN